MSRFGRVDAVLESALGTVFTGAVARIERGGRVVFERALGSTRLDGQARDVHVDTRFDLASLTKPFVATLALQLVDRGVLELDAPLTAYVADWRDEPHAAITLRMLLAHDSGMHSGADYRTILDQDVERFAVTRELAGAPGERVPTAISDLSHSAPSSKSPAAVALRPPCTKRSPPARWAFVRARTCALKFPQPKKMGGADACKERCTTRKRT